MATLNELVQDIRNILSGGRVTQNSPLSKRQIAHLIRSYRSLLIRRDANYWRKMDEMTQDIGIVSTEIVQHDVGRANETPTSVLRTTDRIPEPIRLRRQPALTYIGSPDFDEIYTLTTTGYARYQSYARYTADTPMAYMEGGYIYITSDAVADAINAVLDGTSTLSEVEEDLTTGITGIRIKGLFERPEEAYAFETGEIYDWDEEYPGLADDMVQRIRQSILNGEGQMLVTSVLDAEADTLPVNKQPADNEEAPAQ